MVEGLSGNKSISPIVYMEYYTFLISRGEDFYEFDRILKMAGISVVRFEREQARTASEFMNGLEDRRCRVCNNINWNDCMIAANAPCAPTVLVTKNIDDFEQFAN